MKKYTFKMILCLFLLLQGCASPITLKPIAEQNQQNLEALTHNVQILLALYEPLLTAFGQSVIYQHIGKTEQEIIAVVGAPTLPPPTQGWRKLFTQSAQTVIGKREKYLERYQLVQSAQKRGIDPADMELFKREGWIYQAAMNKKFTPQYAHHLLKRLTELKQKYGGKSEGYFVEAERELSPHDPLLQWRRALINEAQRLLAALKQEIVTELHIAAVHNQAVAHFAQVDTDKMFQQAITTREQLGTVLDRLDQAHVSSFKDVIDLLTKQLGTFFSKK